MVRHGVVTFSLATFPRKMGSGVGCSHLTSVSVPGSILVICVTFPGCVIGDARLKSRDNHWPWLSSLFSKVLGSTDGDGGVVRWLLSAHLLPGLLASFHSGVWPVGGN